MNNSGTIIGRLFQHLKNRTLICLLLGFALVTAYMFPFYWFGENSCIQIWDGLDGWFVFRVFHNDHLVRHALDRISIMNGQTLPHHDCFLFDWSYVFFPPYHALIIEEHFYRFLGFIGMYALLSSLGGSRLPAFLSAALFSLLPYIFFYQGTIAGIPLLLLCIRNVVTNANASKWNYLLVVYIGLVSSVHYIGYWLYPALFFIALAYLVFICRKHDPASVIRHKALRLIVLFILLFIVSLYQYLPFILSGSEASHRNEMSIYLTFTFPFLSRTKDIFFGVDHTYAYGYLLFALALVTMLPGIFLLRRSKERIMALWKYQLLCLMVMAVLSALATLVSAGPLLEWLYKLMYGFNFSRFNWFFPICWIFSFYISLCLLLEYARVINMRKFLACMALMIVALAVQAGGLFSKKLSGGLHDPFLHTAKQFIQDPSSDPGRRPRFRDFYDHELFDRIRDILPSNRNSYSVGSIGLYPSIASYEGFTTIDGYSTLYRLEYKHSFKKIIENELKKNSDLNHYFETWGSRCYLFSSELGRDYFVAKGHSPVAVDYNTAQLKQLNCRYIFSAVPIANSSQLGWQYIDCVSSPGSLYDVFVYRVF